MGATLDFKEDIINPAVVMTFKSDDLLFAGVGACQSNCDLYSFGTGIAKGHQLRTGVALSAAMSSNSH
jgi:hypothetical protein